MFRKSARHKSYAGPEILTERPRLLSWPKILTFTLLILAVMVLLFPRTQLIEQVIQNGGQDPLSRLYLRNLLKDEPENPRLLLMRLNEQIRTGRTGEAEQLILKLQAQDPPSMRLELAQVVLALREQQAFAHPPASPARQRAMPALHQALDALSKLPLPPQDRERLAGKALAYGAGDIAIRLYRSLVTQDAPGSSRKWIEKSAQAALSLGHYREAADIYFEARRLHADLDWEKFTFLAGVRALQSGNLLADALARAEGELGSLSAEPDILVFMVRLAQAANRNDRAEVYVRRLLRFAELGLMNRPALQQASTDSPASSGILSDALSLSRKVPTCRDRMNGSGCWQRMQGKRPATIDTALKVVRLEPQLPFDDEIYRLGYDVFLANRNLSSAYGVAYAAVRQAPDNRAWRVRLAQVAEWNGEPAHALEQWRYLALSQDSEQAWQALLRLAPGLFDEASVALALVHEHQKGRLSDARLLRLVQAFEAMGEARKGVAFLEQAYRTSPRRLMLEQQAWLEERLGQSSEAIATLRKLGRIHGFAPAETRRLASLLIAQGYLSEAYRTLQQQEDRAARIDPAYQALMAELAWHLQDRQTAIRIYQTLQIQRPLEDHEAERLILLVRADNPAAAARLAARLWDQYHKPRYLYLAVESYIQSRDIPAARALLASLTPAELTPLDQQVDFLQLRAEVHRRGGDMPEAIRLMQRAVQLQPDNPGLAAHLMWVLVEARDREQLAPLLQKHLSQALNEPLFWGPMGAGFMVLARPLDALPFYARQAAARREDYLWQVDYAHVLESAGQADMAWRIRRHAWLNLRRAGKPDASQLDAWQAMAGLALRMAPGDTSAQWLREWLRLDGQGQPQHSPEAREMATAWFLTNERYESARLWLTQQYGQQLQAPGWAEATLALQGNDTAALKKIVEGEGADILPETRVEAALQLRHFAAARRLATAGLDATPTNDVLHLQLTDSVWQQQNHVGAGYRREDLGALRRKGWRTGVQWSVTPALKMGMTLSEDTLSSLDTTRLANLPGTDRKITFFGKLETVLGETVLKLFHRKAVDSQAGLQLEHQLKLDRRLSLTAGVGYNLDADESDVLSAGGSKDTLRLGAQWLISKRDYLIADLSANSYHGQDRNELGKSMGLEVQLGHHLRVEYPDLTIKLLGSAYRFDEHSGSGGVIRTLLPPGTGLLPESFNQFGIGLGMGESISEQFSRAFRPYGTLDLLHSSGAGWGYGLELGFVVSPTGQDWLRGRYRKGQNTFGGSQDASLLDLEYRYLF